MKKIFSCLFVLTILSCGPFKKIEKKEVSKTSDKTHFLDKDSIVLTEINKAIDDLIKIKVSDSNTNDKVLDSIVNSKVDEILEKINLQKTSGSNQYQISYNKLKREIEASMKVGETKSTSTDIKKDEKTTSVETETISTYIKKIKGIPFYWYLIALLIIFRKQILALLLLFFPLLKYNKLFSSLQGTSRLNEIETRQIQQNDLIIKLLEKLTQQNPN